LMLCVLRQCPSIANVIWILEASQYNTPKSLKCLLDLLPDEKIPRQTLLNAVVHRQEDSVRILIDSGRVSDSDGSVLAHTCSIKNRDFFDMVLPISNLDAAIHMAPKDNLHWLTEVFAARQNERLHQTIDIPTASRTRKI